MGVTGSQRPRHDFPNVLGKSWRAMPGAKAPVVTPRRSYVGLVPACPDGQVGNAPGRFQPVTPLPLLPHPPSWRACARHLVRSRPVRPETVSNRAPSALRGRSSYSSIVLLILWRRGSPPRRLRSPPTAPLVAKHSLANRTQDTARSSATRRADGDSLSTGVAGIALQSGAAAAAATGIRTTSSVTSSRPARAQCMPDEVFFPPPELLLWSFTTPNCYHSQPLNLIYVVMRLLESQRSHAGHEVLV